MKTNYYITMRDCMAVRITTPFLQLARQAARIAVNDTSVKRDNIWELASQLQMRAYGRKVCH